MKSKRVVMCMGLLGVAAIAVVLMLRKDSLLPPKPDSAVGPESTASVTGATFRYWPTEDGTYFNTSLKLGSSAMIGRETWEKGDKITFQISSTDAFSIEVGIIPAENMDEGYRYDDYGMLIGKTIDITPEVQTVTFTVPASGEYGIGFYNSNFSSVNFSFDLNKEFHNPLTI